MSLQEEMEFLQKYLDIEQTRFQDRLTVHVNIDPDALDGEVPRMILQPLVENAIKHGIAGRDGGGQISNRAGRDGERLWMQVRDNGVGLQGAHAAGAAHRRRPLEHARSARLSLRPRITALEFSDRTAGSRSLIDMPFQRGVRRGTDAPPAGRMSHDDARTAHAC